MLNCVSAATSPSPVDPEFGAVTNDGSGSEKGSPDQKKDPPPSTCGCSDEIKAMAGDFMEKIEAMHQRQEAFYQFMGMTPP